MQKSYLLQEKLTDGKWFTLAFYPSLRLAVLAYIGMGKQTANALRLMSHGGVYGGRRGVYFSYRPVGQEVLQACLDHEREEEERALRQG